METIEINKVKYVKQSDADKAIVAERKKKAPKGGKVLPFDIGGKYFIRTVSYFATGEVVAIHGDFLELTKAAWVADTGRFRQAIMDGVLNEVEPVDVPMYVNTASITDAFVWRNELPVNQK
jgi:hypothetical protein